MLFALYAKDGPDGPTRRAASREAHVAYVSAANDAGRIAFAGPLKDETGKSIGALIIFEAEDAPSARRWVENDPYVQAAVYVRLEVTPVAKAFPKT